MNQEIINKFVEIDSDIRLTVNPYSENLYLQPDKFFMTDFDYPTLNVIDKIELTDFEMYCIDALTEEKIMYLSQDYTLLSVKDKILIVFHNYRTFTAKTYLYAEYNGLKSLIQVSLFEDIQKFSQTVDITRLQDFAIIMSVPSAGHIVYLRLKPINGVKIDDDYNNDSIVPAVTRTMFEIMKLIYEWAAVSGEPFNNIQDISTKAKGFIDGLGIPEPIKESINSLQTDMQVYRYLAGSENARQRPPLDEIALMPQSVYDWFKQQFCYRSFDNLVLYHPVFN